MDKWWKADLTFGYLTNIILTLHSKKIKKKLIFLHLGIVIQSQLPFSSKILGQVPEPPIFLLLLFFLAFSLGNLPYDNQSVGHLPCDNHTPSPKR